MDSQDSCNEGRIRVENTELLETLFSGCWSTWGSFWWWNQSFVSQILKQAETVHWTSCYYIALSPYY